MADLEKNSGNKTAEEIQQSIDALMAKMQKMNEAQEKRKSEEGSVAVKRKISEKSMTMTLFATLISIVLISALLVTTTWAWFSESVTTSENTITSATCTVDTVVSEGGSALLGTPTADGMKYTLLGGVEYTVVAKVTGTGTGGYLKLCFESDATPAKYSEVILSNSYVEKTPEDDTNTITFTISVESGSDVIIKSYWGNHGIDTPDIYSGEKYLYKESTGELVKLP